jgi:hypothetical protein
MAHCGFEGTAVNDAFSHPFKALRAAMNGPRLVGPMAPELPVLYAEGARHGTVAAIPIADIKRMGRDSEESRGLAAPR